MLHKVNLPGCLPQLERIVEFQREVLLNACETKYQLPLQEANIIKLFGDKKGTWLWKKLWTQPKKMNGILPPKKESTLNIYIQKLTKFYQKNTREGADTLSAFDNDILFADNLNNPNFRFQYSLLRESNRNLIRPLMVLFYEELLASGFFEEIHGAPQRLNREDFITSFWNKNPDLNVCPACDRERSDSIGTKKFDDADHFLPKSKYPFLSLHPYNLFPLCIYCNRSFKGSRDSIDNPNSAPLLNIFHPYKRTAISKLDLKVYRDILGVSKLGSFMDIDGMPSRRMESLKRVFRLDKRWIDRLRIQKEVVIDKVIEEGARLRRRNQEDLINETELNTMLQEEQESTISKYGRRANFIVQNSYLTNALSDNAEFEELYGYFANI